MSLLQACRLIQMLDGTELCVVQKLGDLLDTSVYYRKPGTNWGWFYYDHEDSYWAKATILSLQPKSFSLVKVNPNVPEPARC